MATVNKLKDYCTVNLDESGFQGSLGKLKVIGNAKKKKHEKNVSDNRDSVTSIRIGSAGNVDGPRIYLAKGETHESKKFENFTKYFRAPEGSFVEMTPNGELLTI